MAAWVSWPHMWLALRVEQKGRSLISSMGRASKSARSRMQGLPLPMVATTPVEAAMSGKPMATYFFRISSGITPHRWEGMPISESRFSM